MIYRFFLCITLLSMIGLSAQALGINEDKKKAEEIRKLMWDSKDKDFAVTKTPEKWDNKGAVIIAKSNYLSYRKSVMVANLNFDNYSHYRIMLLDSKALEKYAQFSIPENGNYRGVKYEYYAGFKIIKPTGKEIVVPMEQAVRESREINSTKLNILKLAIANLEIGDILDYYIAEEQNITVAKLYTFSPEIFELHDTYPILKQKISFDVMRRCYINLRTFNGAPKFKFTEDAEKDGDYYLLEDGDRESVKDIRWLFPYRELPTVKFKVTYATGSVAGTLPLFIGEPGVIKSDVSRAEVAKLVKYLFSGYTTSTTYATLNKTMKKKYKKLKDNNKLAREAFYELRNIERISGAESRLVSGEAQNPGGGRVKSLAELSQYYRSKKIPHEILIGIPRDISDLDDLTLENELTYMLKVNTSKPFYVGNFDNHSVPDDIDPDLQGQKVYSANGLQTYGDWVLMKSSVPIVPHTENNIKSVYKIKVADLEKGSLDVDITKTTKKANKQYGQNLFMDVYSYLDEEQKRFSNSKSTPVPTKKASAQRSDYMSSRDENFNKALKKDAENELESLVVEEVSDLQILQTGRFEEKPEFIYSFKAKVKDGIRKVGPNYLIDIGKFIEGQVQIGEEEQTRKYNVYMPFARSFSYRIELEIPQGYTIQGEEKLNSSLENETGGFTSTAKIEGNVLVVETYKYYKSNYEPVEKWSMITDFLAEAFSFSQKQILLKKS